MKLKSIKLHPFAGILDKEINFKDQLNVLCGPNEIGKSTIFHALLNVLLTTTSQTGKQLDDTMGCFFPVSGGDTIRVTLELEKDDEGIIWITKTWKKGTRNGSENLQMPDRTEITNEDAVQKQIEELLPVSPATLKTILLADQSGLHHTIQEMKKEDHVRKELGDLLRQNLMETGGVSVDQFRELLDQKYDDYFKRWDREQDYPENNRGINNPYKVGTGEILDAYYKKEQLQLDLKDAKQFENDLDKVNKQLTDFAEKRQEKLDKYNRLNPLKEGVRQKQLKEQQLSSESEKRANLLEVSKKWPVYEDRIDNLEPKKKEKQKEIDKLADEFKTSQNKDKANQLKDRISKLEKLSNNVQESKSELKDAKIIESSDVKELRNFRSEMNSLQATINAARLTVRVMSDKDRAVNYIEAGKEEQNVDLKSGKKVEITASGGFKLENNGLSVEVFSGEGDLESTINNLNKKEKEFNKLLKKLDVDSLQSAESFSELYSQKVQKHKEAENLYSSELGENKLENLKNDLKNYGDLEGIRSMEDINEDLSTAKSELKSLNDQASEAEIKLNEWKEKYSDLDSALVSMGDVSSKIKRVAKEIEGLPDLPEGYETPEDFINAIESLDSEIKSLDNQINDLKVEKAQMEGGAPETSSEELAKMHEEANLEFDRIFQQANTLAKVRERSIELLESMDSETYSGLEESFSKWLNKMTLNRFESIQLEEDLPQLFNTTNGHALTYDILSHGTKDTVALAWRFALAEHFLTDQSCFVILDDPMVDMDPNRRELASKAITEFAKEHQVLLMTCHPEHAEMVSSNGEILEF